MRGRSEDAWNQARYRRYSVGGSGGGTRYARLLDVFGARRRGGKVIAPPTAADATGIADDEKPEDDEEEWRRRLNYGFHRRRELGVIADA